MAIKQSELQEIVTQLVLLNEQFTTLKNMVEKSVGDHEARLRTLETNHGNIERDISTIRERMTIFNLMQGTLTAIVGVVAVWLSKK